jgi:hypothetical protein
MPVVTVSTSVPSVASCSSTAACAPRPSASMAITAATPMITPSIVSAARNALPRMESSASFTVSQNGISVTVAWRAAAARRAPVAA